MMRTEPISVRRYATIDFLKALGSITILIHHYFVVSEYGVPTNLTGGGSGLFSFICNYGYLAVELFFLLSGFIAATFRAKPISRGETDLNRFLAPKWSRWYPSIFFTTLVCLIVQNVAITLTGSMVLGLDNYNLFDIFCNFFVAQVGLFSERSALNVPLWFLTPLLVCYVIFFLIERKSGGCKNVAYAVCVVVGGTCIYYGFRYPILNVQLGRGVYTFFLGVLLQKLYERTRLRLRLGGKVFLLAGIVVSLVYFWKGTVGNQFLCVSLVFALILSLILSCPKIDYFFERRSVRAWYKPFYQISFELFCSQYVVLTAIGLIQRYRDLSSLAENWTLFWGYIVLSYALAFLLKRTARPLFSCIFFKS